MTNAEPDDGVFERGVAMRRRVLGDAHVDRSLADASEFARPVQDLVTEYCGAPAALESFRVAERVLAEMGVDD